MGGFPFGFPLHSPEEGAEPHTKNRSLGGFFNMVDSNFGIRGSEKEPTHRKRNEAIGSGPIRILRFVFFLQDKSMRPIIDRAVRTVNEALQVAGKAENRSLRALVLFKRAELLVLQTTWRTCGWVGGWVGGVWSIQLGFCTAHCFGRPRIHCFGLRFGQFWETRWLSFESGPGVPSHLHAFKRNSAGSSHTDAAHF